METTQRAVSVRDSNGNYRTEHRTETHRVADFDFFVDVGGYVQNEWDRIAAVNSKTNKLLDIKSLMQLYAESKNMLKELSIFFPTSLSGSCSCH
jgi:hypothetical protein